MNRTGTASIHRIKITEGTYTFKFCVIKDFDRVFDSP